MRRPQQPQQPRDVSVEINGKTYHGTYTTESGTVTVSNGYSRQTTHVGGSHADVIARMMLREIVQAALDKGHPV
ncbi:hypothetical protein BH10PSE17_BH10PSE17_25020 [soil metagenome]